MKSYFVDACLEKRIKRDFPDFEIKVDKNLHIEEKAINQFLAEKKTIFVRYKKDLIYIPAAKWIPYFVINNEKQKNKYLALIEITKITIKRFNQLNLEDAIKDGLHNKEELIKVIESRYGKMEDKELISLYHLKKII